MKYKKIISAIIVGSMIIACTGCATQKTSGVERSAPEKVTETTVEETTVDETGETTDSVDATHPKIASAIYVNMSDMTIDEMVKNIWKTNNITVGMSKAEYFGQYVYSAKDVTTKVENAFYWEFDPINATSYIKSLDVVIATNSNNVVTEIDKNSYVELGIRVVSSSEAQELFGALLLNYKANGYKVISEDAGNIKDSKIITLSGYDHEFKIRIIGQDITIILPIVKTKVTDTGDTDIDAITTIIDENGMSAEVFAAVTEAITDDGNAPQGKPVAKDPNRPVKK